MTDHAIDTMLLEERRYPPPEEFAAQANAKAEYTTHVAKKIGAIAKPANIVFTPELPTRSGTEKADEAEA